MLLFNDCGVIELDIASKLYSIELFDHVQLLMKGGSEPSRTRPSWMDGLCHVGVCRSALW